MCALWEKKRPVATSPFLYFYFYSFCSWIIFFFLVFGPWYLSKPHWHMTSKGSFAAKKAKKLFKTTKAPSSTWLHRHHKQPGHLWGWTDPPPPQGRTYTAAEQLGRVRRVKVRPGEGVIALPYEPSWGPKALAFTSTQAPSGVDMSAQYDEQQQPGMYPWATTQNLRRNYTSLILAAL